MRSSVWLMNNIEKKGFRISTVQGVGILQVVTLALVCVVVIGVSRFSATYTIPAETLQRQAVTIDDLRQLLIDRNAAYDDLAGDYGALDEAYSRLRRLSSQRVTEMGKLRELAARKGVDLPPPAAVPESVTAGEELTLPLPPKKGTWLGRLFKRL